LRLLRHAVGHGHSIGRLAGLHDNELRSLAATADEAGVPAVDPIRQPWDTGALFAALRTYNAEGIDQEIARLSAVLRPRELLQDVLLPVLVQVGDEWCRGRVVVAQEHLMSSAIRNILGSFLRLHTRRDVPARLLFTTPSGDRHEIGTLGASMLAAMSGLGATYLGPDLPARDILESVKPAGAQVLVLGLTTTSAKKTTERELHEIVSGLPRDIELWAGGRGVERYAVLLGQRGLVLRDYEAYQRELVRIGGHIA
jgi:methanogenic corrinoid protein MtbC1